MNQDIKISNGDNKFKFRVSGILIVDNKLLTVKIENNDFYCLPGGHVELMENTKDAIIREFYEETRIKVDIDRLVYVTENFFNGNLGNCHEIGFYYLLKPKNKIMTKDFNLIEKDKEGNVRLDFKWISIDNLENFKPEFIKEEIKNDSKDIKHFIIFNDKLL
jgi:ADP-ribose pyrophosphatase YjhB (NUDIX family)